MKLFQTMSAFGAQSNLAIQKTGTTDILLVKRMNTKNRDSYYVTSKEKEYKIYIGSLKKLLMLNSESESFYTTANPCAFQRDGLIKKISKI